ncbi:MAG TPA: corrinoid protein [Candidatus Alistipes intestinipullorum]|nr:corrinoid protein [Candidatus Alistipes intestinipullorum]
MKDYNELYEAILAGSLEKAVEVTKQAVEDKVDPQDIINLYMIKAMEEIGRRFEAGKVFVPNLLMSARAMRGALDILKPLLSGHVDTYIGKVVIGTVKGDLHDIGKNLVASMFEGCGFEVINLGVDVSSEKFVEAARANHANIVCMSALLTTTMNYMKEVIAAIEKAGIRDDVKIMVGGAPLNDAFAKSIGADAYTSNANAAVVVAKELLGKN